jgi:hypothetical protein
MVKLFEHKLVESLITGTLDDNTVLKTAFLQVLTNIVLKIASSKV